jgi:hypothetical protein
VAMTDTFNRDSSARSAATLATRERRPGWVALALALIVGVAAVFGYLYQQAGAKSPVVVMARTVAAGHVIARADLSTVAVAGDITAIDAGELDRVVGQEAAVTVPEGTLVQQSMLAAKTGLQDGQAQVGVAIASGQMPSDGVKPGDTVDLLQFPGRGSSDTDAIAEPSEALVRAVTVWATRPDPAQPGGTLITLKVPSESVAQIVSANGSGRVAVVKVAPGS